MKSHKTCWLLDALWRLPEDVWSVLEAPLGLLDLFSPFPHARVIPMRESSPRASHPHARSHANVRGHPPREVILTHEVIPTPERASPVREVIPSCEVIPTREVIPRCEVISTRAGIPSVEIIMLTYFTLTTLLGSY